MCRFGAWNCSNICRLERTPSSGNRSKLVFDARGRSGNNNTRKKEIEINHGNIHVWRIYVCMCMCAPVRACYTYGVDNQQRQFRNSLSKAVEHTMKTIFHSTIFGARDRNISVYCGVQCLWMCVHKWKWINGMCNQCETCASNTHQQQQ